MVRIKKRGSQLTAELCGEIDHCTSAAIRQQIEAALADERITSLHLDFTQVSFMDSSGIGMVIGRYKTMMSRRGRITSSGANESVKRVYRLAGLHRIIPMLDNGGAHD